MCKHLEKASDKASRTACLSCTGLQKYKYSCIFCKLATVYNLDIVKYNLRKAHVIIWWLSRYRLVYNCFQVATISVLHRSFKPIHSSYCKQLRTMLHHCLPHLTMQNAFQICFPPAIDPDMTMSSTSRKLLLYCYMLWATDYTKEIKPALSQ